MHHTTEPPTDTLKDFTNLRTLNEAQRHRAPELYNCTPGRLSVCLYLSTAFVASLAQWTHCVLARISCQLNCAWSPWIMPEQSFHAAYSGSGLELSGSSLESTLCLHIIGLCVSLHKRVHTDTRERAGAYNYVFLNWIGRFKRRLINHGRCFDLYLMTSFECDGMNLAVLIFIYYGYFEGRLMNLVVLINMLMTVDDVSIAVLLFYSRIIMLKWTLKLILLRSLWFLTLLVLKLERFDAVFVCVFISLPLMPGRGQR